MSIEITITFSMSSHRISIPSAVADSIELHYGCCDYCSKDMRLDQILPNHRSRFCDPKEKSLYHFHKIDQC